MPAVAAAAPPRGFVGLQGWWKPPSADTERLGRANVRLWRTNLNWSAIDRGDGTYRWAGYDALFERAAASGIRIMPVLVGSPEWVAPRQSWPPQGRAHRRAYNRFAAAAVRRYGPNGAFWQGKPYSRWVRAHWWQVWNEPNHRSWWTEGDPDAADYASLLIGASAAAKRADPAVRISTGGLPQVILSRSCKELCISKYLTRVFRVPGAARAIDGVSVHAYTRETRDIVTRVDYAREVMDGFRDARGKPIWITEIGWATAGRHGSYPTVSRAEQARRLKDAYRLLLRVRHSRRLLGAVWFSFRDPAGTEGWSHYYRHTGLFDGRGVAKPAWRALLEVTGGRG